MNITTLSLIRLDRINFYFIFCSFVYFTLSENYIYGLYLIYCIWVFIYILFLYILVSL